MPRMNPDHQVRQYEEAKSLRSPYEADWRLASAYCLPRQYSGWQSAGGPPPSHGGGGTAAAARRVAYDTTGVRSLPKYVSVLTRVSIPRSQIWHVLEADNPDLQKLRAVKLYFEQVTAILFKERYKPRARFETGFGEAYNALGTYGMGPLYLGRRTPNALDRRGGLMYKACAMRDIFVLVDDNGEVSTVFRRYWLNGRKYKAKFPDTPAPRSVAAELSKPAGPSETTYFEFVHVVSIKPAEDHDPEAFDDRRFPITGSHMSVQDKEYVGDEHGYFSMPYLTPRTYTEADDPYGFSPAMQALPALGTASATKKSYLKQGQRATDQVLLAPDDGVLGMNPDLRPGRVTYGAVNSQGQKLVHALETGNFQIAENILADERHDIEDSFFVTLFQILTETPEMSATEVLERVSEKGSLVAPTMGRLQSELLGPTIEREMDILTEMGRVPPLPPELAEAEGEYKITYTSPMAKMQTSENMSGFLRAVEIAISASQATGDPSKLDYFNFDVAIPELSNNLAVPVRWMNDENVIQATRDRREAQMQQEQLINAAPALTGAVKAASEMRK